jgi:hypothetical protein
VGAVAGLVEELEDEAAGALAGLLLQVPRRGHMALRIEHE